MLMHMLWHFSAQAFREDTEAWLIGSMYVMVHNVRQLACQADDEATRLGRKSDALENCGTQLQKCFSAAVQGAGERLSIHLVMKYCSHFFLQKGLSGPVAPVSGSAAMQTNQVLVS